MVGQQWRGQLSWAEALQAGRIGLWRALEGYRPERGTRFSSYAVPAIARAVWGAVAEAEPLRPVPGAGPAAVWWEPDLVADLDRAAVIEAVRGAVAGWPERWRQVVVWHWGLAGEPPQTFGAIGQRLGGVSRQRVHQLHGAALRALADPAASLGLQRVLGRRSRTDYRRALGQARAAARARRARTRRRAS